MLPLILLKAAQGHPIVSRVVFLSPCMNTSLISSHAPLPRPPPLQLVELKNGETYNGHLIQCDNWMNMHIREVICTAKVLFEYDIVVVTTCTQAHHTHPRLCT